MRTIRAAALCVVGLAMILAWGPFGYFIGGCLMTAGLLMIAQEMRRFRAARVSPEERQAIRMQAELVAMTPRPPAPRIVRWANRVGAWGMSGLAITALYSLFFSSFVPAPATVATAKIMAALVGLFYAAFFVGFHRFGWDPRSPQVMAAIGARPFLGRAFLRAPFMATVFAGFGWMSFSSGLPAAWTELAGRPGTMTILVKGWEPSAWGTRSGRSCARPTVEGVPFGMLGRNALCMDDRQASGLPPGSVLLLSGRVSYLGILPDRYHVGSASSNEALRRGGARGRGPAS